MIMEKVQEKELKKIVMIGINELLNLMEKI